MMESLKVAGALPTKYWPLLESATALSTQEAPTQLTLATKTDVMANLLNLLSPATILLAAPSATITPMDTSPAPTSIPPDSAHGAPLPAATPTKMPTEYVPLAPYLKANLLLHCCNFPTDNEASRSSFYTMHQGLQHVQLHSSWASYKHDVLDPVTQKLFPWANIKCFDTYNEAVAYLGWFSPRTLSLVHASPTAPHL
eukprot:14983234-Ditylum_brightwellii.AAC.1